MVGDASRDCNLCKEGLSTPAFVFVNWPPSYCYRPHCFVLIPTAYVFTAQPDVLGNLLIKLKNGNHKSGHNGT